MIRSSTLLRLTYNSVQVVQVRQKETGQHFALKVVDKHLVLRNSYTEYIKTERKLLDRLDSPWIVNLHFTFQDTHSLYFVLELCPNGNTTSCPADQFFVFYCVLLS